MHCGLGISLFSSGNTGLPGCSLNKLQVFNRTSKNLSLFATAPLSSKPVILV